MGQYQADDWWQDKKVGGVGIIFGGDKYFIIFLTKITLKSVKISELYNVAKEFAKMSH